MNYTYAEKDIYTYLIYVNLGLNPSFVYLPMNYPPSSQFWKKNNFVKLNMDFYISGTWKRGIGDAGNLRMKIKTAN